MSIEHSFVRGVRGVLAVAALLGLGSSALAWDQPQWVRQLGTSTDEDATGVATDRDGNVYITGTTRGPLGGPEVGQDDAWLAKYSGEGVLLWKRQLGTSTFDRAFGVATYGDDVYICGDTNGAFDGSPILTNGQAFIAKYSVEGDLLWTRQLGTTDFGYSTTGIRITTSGDGKVYIAGFTSGNLGGSGSSRGGLDAFVAKYSREGLLLWTEQLGTQEGATDTTGVTTDPEGNVYVAGFTDGSLGAPNAGIADAWVAKYSAAGALLWIRQQGTSLWDYSRGITTDGEGGVYIAGDTFSSVVDYSYAWVAKYSTAGALLWKRRLNTPGYESSRGGIAADDDGKLYISGDTSGSLGGPSSGSAGAWLAKYSTAGARLWVRQLGQRGLIYGYIPNGVATDGGGNVYMAGFTDGTLGGPNRGGLDAFVAKYFTRR